MKAILFQMPIMPIMTFAPSYWCIRSANPFGRQKCPGSQLLHLEALGQEIGSQSLKDLRIYENQRWFKKNSKDLHRDVRAALPGSSAVGGRPITAARRGGNGWRQRQWRQCRLQRDQRIYGFPRHPARHVATACRGTSSTFFTESIYTVAPLPCRTVLYHAVPSYHVWLHHFFTGSHYIHNISHMITYDHMNEKRFGSRASVKYVPAPHSKAPHTSIYILYKYGPYLAWVAKSSASDDGVPES